LLAVLRREQEQAPQADAAFYQRFGGLLARRARE
jgi:hypothetical protein